MFFHYSKDSDQGQTNGFSLLELLIIGAILSVLVTLAVPSFHLMMAKSRMAEAKNVLNQIYTLQETYHLQKGTYLAIPKIGRVLPDQLVCTNREMEILGLELTPCQGNAPLYAYEVIGGTLTIEDSFVALAHSGDQDANFICPGYPAHVWQMNERRELNFRFVKSKDPVTAYCGEK